ncbi:uncharacterized protein LOC125495578 [Beta vulgaris subsp. vulgaris]|uniref:uncharacterized protein LOC125495578 n=1 Tax=Beta vulgaris subsp. vulgaris TaxID=3555 RepID=UPI002036F155|nr:uncharacterized protein LOC125495578 [Beta vulgaris subsp. vulgaris]
MRYNRGERCRGEGRDLSVAERVAVKTKGCGCRARIKIMFLDYPDQTGWVIKADLGISGMHNHEFIHYHEGHRPIIGLSPAIEVFARDMIKSHVRLASIMKAVNEKFYDDHPNMRLLYNLKEKDRMEAMDGRDVVQQFLHLDQEYNYIYWIRQDEETNVMTQAFIVHPRYNWVLDKFRLLIGVKVDPVTLITDRDLGLMKAVRDVFPNSAHLMGYLAVIECIRDIYRYWHGTIKYVEITWLVYKEKFVRAWTDIVLHLGNTCTSRVESAHSALKSWGFSSACALHHIFYFS